VQGLLNAGDEVVDVLTIRPTVFVGRDSADVPDRPRKSCGPRIV
jgi:hypothetical protein